MAEEILTETPELTPEQKEVMEKIQSASIKINEILKEYALEFTVIHKLVVNKELKQEEIFHDIILKPRKA